MTFEKEYGALAASADLDESATRELLAAYRRAAGLLAERASALQSRESYRDLATYLIPNEPITDADAKSISLVYTALKLQDEIDASVRGSDLADLTDHETVFSQARQRAGLPSSFTMPISAIQRLRALV